MQMLTNNESSAQKAVYCAVTIDGDLRVGTAQQHKQAVRAVRGVHQDLGLLEHTSWLINEHDFCWTELHPELLLQLAESGECIGMHDHLDTQYLENEPTERIYDFLAVSRSKVAAFYRRAGLECPILVHRNGGAQQGREIYRALARMEYTIVSDVWPGMKWYTRIIPQNHPVQHWKSLDREEDAGSIFTDNSQIPLNATPWRHDEGNWLDINSRTGRFLHIPITCLPVVDRGRIKAAVGNSGQKLVLVIDTHPYNLQDPETGEVSEHLVQDYMASLAWIRDSYRAVFIRMDQVPDLMPFVEE